MGNIESTANVPRGRDDEMLRHFTSDAEWRLKDIAMRSGVVYGGSSVFLYTMGSSPGIAKPVALALAALEVAPEVVDLLRQTVRRIGGIPQYALVQAIVEGEQYPAIFNEKIRRRSQYEVKYRNERYTITGIACVPVSKEIQSPEAAVVEGGLNYSYVIIRLTPEKDYEYGCQIIITGKEREPDRRQSNTEPNDERLSLAVPEVAVSLPSFLPDQPGSSFANAEGQFELAAITCQQTAAITCQQTAAITCQQTAAITCQQTKYNCVVSQLNQHQTVVVKDIITSPPKHEPYDRLKAELVPRLSTSREQHMHPTTVSVSPATPDNTAGLLEAIQELSHQLASLRASRSHSRSQSRDRHHSQSRDRHHSQSRDRHHSQSTDRRQSQSRDRHHSQSRDRHHSQSTDRHHSQSRDSRRSTPKQSATPHNVCWYHLRFGDKAHKCIPPCSYQHRDSHQQENSGSQR